MIDSLVTFSLGVGQLISLLLLAFATHCIYSAYFGPLSKYPGPIWWTLTQFPRAGSQMKGELAFRMLEFHEKYGPIVRLAPNELSFVNEGAWGDIYGKNDGKQQLAKDPNVVVTPPNGIPGLAFTPDDAAHGRMKRNLAAGFTAQAVREQEPILSKYIDLLITRLRQKAGNGDVDISHWFHLFTFDLVGDLTFGKSFEGLEKSELHPWISNLFFFIQARVWISGILQILPIGGLAIWLGRKRYADEDKLHLETVHTRLASRLAMPRDASESRKDFITHIEKRLDKDGGISTEELQDTAAALIIGGSETTATALTGMTYFLLTNQTAYSKIVNEIRGSFEKEEDITMASVIKLEYELAVIDEALRLFPPLPSQIRRVCPPGGVSIDGNLIPGGTMVSVPQWACFRSSLNFERPNEFLPERFLPVESSSNNNEFQEDRKKTFQPFSTGPRGCPGKALAYAEMRMVLARLLWNFDLELVQQGHQGWMDGLQVWGIYKKSPLIVKLKRVERV